MTKYLYGAVLTICLIMLSDITLTAYGVAARAGMEVNPLIMALWRSLPLTSGFEFILMVIALYTIAVLSITGILVYATIYAPLSERNVGKALCIGAAGTHAMLFGGVLLLNVII